MGKLLTFPPTLSLSAGKRGEATSKKIHPINARLAELGQTQSWLAHKMGCNPSTVRNFISGRTRMKRGRYERMLTILNVTENYIYSVGSRERHK
jgi:hypothetical protein